MEKTFFDKYSPSELYENCLKPRYCFYENPYQMQLDLPYIFPSEVIFRLKSFWAMCKESSEGEYSSGNYEEVWAGGVLRARGRFKNCLPFDVWRFFHDNGNCAEIVSLNDNGNIFAHHNLFYSNGQMSFSFEHSCPDVTGTLREWFPNGNIKSEIKVYKGNQQGMCRRWFENGQLANEGEFVNGKKAGNYSQWNENGVLIFERIQTFNSTLFCEKVFDDDGQILQLRSYKDDGLHGEEVQYFDYERRVFFEKPQVTYYLNNGKVLPSEFCGRTGVIIKA